MDGRRDNLLIVQCHALGRFLAADASHGVPTPRLDALAARGVVFSAAYATAPLSSPALGSMYTGRHPHSHGLIRPVHQGWEYRCGVRTLAKAVSAAGWRSAIFGTQHETALPKRLGYHEYDLSDAPGACVAALAGEWLRERMLDPEPFLATVGLPDVESTGPDHIPSDNAIASADAAVGRLLDALVDTGLDADTWVVFMTDHGPTSPPTRATLHDPAIAITLVVRPPRTARIRPRVYPELFSGTDLMPTLLDLLGIGAPDDVEGKSHARNLAGDPQSATAVHDHVFSSMTYHDSFDLARALRTKRYSYLENYEKQPSANVFLETFPGSAVKVIIPNGVAAPPERELYDRLADPRETCNLLAGQPEEAHLSVADELAETLRAWRQNSEDFSLEDDAGLRFGQAAGQYWCMRSGGARRGRGH